MFQTGFIQSTTIWSIGEGWIEDTLLGVHDLGDIVASLGALDERTLIKEEGVGVQTRDLISFLHGDGVSSEA